MALGLEELDECSTHSVTYQQQDDLTNQSLAQHIKDPIMVDREVWQPMLQLQTVKEAVDFCPFAVRLLSGPFISQSDS